MKILKFSSIDTYDFMVFGLGYESRSISAFTELYSQDEKAIAVGYERHTDALFYEENRKCFSDAGVDVIEGKDSCVLKEVYKRIDLLIDGNLPSNVLLDITVLSRHRLASILDRLITTLPIGSTLTLAYYLSGYVEPPEGTTPIRLVSEITPEFSGAIGDLSLPTSLILGLGYEKEKALGLSNYLEAGNEYIFIPCLKII